jgi:hypothetical protein
MRVSDAQCLAAAHAAKSNEVSLLQVDGRYVVFDGNAPAGKQVLANDTDLEKIKISYEIAYFRPMLEAALNVC